ncbi:MAG: histidinol dehydrogenase [Planctomycetota bacterium]|jgi:histidinol dehydrogenase/phosphoribosyl-ATP pyrophosphohydrolase
MIIPSLDLRQGQAVQLVGGAGEPKLRVAPEEVLAPFLRTGQLAIIDLDAAFGEADQAARIQELVPDLSGCRVGGGIRDVERAKRWLDAGVGRTILGTAATPELLRQLPRERVMVALDARDGEVVVDGWRRGTGRRLEDALAELRPYADSFLITLVEREGRLGGTDLERAAALREAAGDAAITLAGGVTTVEEVAALDRLGLDAQVGMALYQGRMDLAEAFTAPLTSDRADGLWPTVVVDEDGVALGLAYSDLESVNHALTTGEGAYRSRRRGLWVKGASSGATQEVLRLEVDCDRDSLRMVVRQAGEGFCHRGSRSCFQSDGGAARGGGIPAMERRLAARRAEIERGDEPEGSYVAKLLADPSLIDAKLAEEVAEVQAASTPRELREEAADLLFFLGAKLEADGVSWEEVGRSLDRRAGATRRGGERKDGAASSPAPADEGMLLPPREAEELLATRRQEPHPLLTRQVAGTLAALREEGEVALRREAMRFGEIEADAPLRIERAELRAAWDGLDPEVRDTLDRIATRIETFARRQAEAIQGVVVEDEGVRSTLDYRAVKRAGCYAPGGRYPLPSSVLMTALTARAAGVEEIVVASPKPQAVTLAAAYRAGADCLLPLGGAHAIGAMVEGLGPIPACDAIVGPGNRWVTEAKRQVAGRVALDMLAGPTELLALADATADPEVVAADLLAQGEHDPDARPWLATTDPAVADAVRAACARQLAELSTAEVASTALRAAGVVLLPDTDALLAFAGELAPEHLSLHLADAEALAPRCEAQGALFIGSACAEVLADYGAGPNHTLPTGGLARSFGALSVTTFLRTQVGLSGTPSAGLSADAVVCARLEGLEAHARAAEARLA